MTRPWCACGRVRLGERGAPVVEETPARVAFHADNRCQIFRVARSQAEKPRSSSTRRNLCAK